MMISPSFGALAHASKDRASRPSLNEGDILVQAGFDKDKVKAHSRGLGAQHEGP